MFRSIGLRTVKTAISIGFCMLLYVLFKTLDTTIKINGISLYAQSEGFRFSDFYSPFFAGIAAAYSLYPSRKQSIAQAKNRVVASLIGGLVGIILTISYGLIGYISKNDFFTWPNLGQTFRVEQYIVPYCLITLFVFVVIIVGNALGKKAAIFVGILTFISVTINPMGMIVDRYNQTAPFLGEAVFGTNRILSTIFGVFISLAVNFFRLPRKHKNEDMVFYIGIGGLLREDSDSLNGYFKYKLIEAKERDIPCSIFTTRAPMTFMHLLNDVEIGAPICCMSGAAMFDPKIDKYIYREAMDKDLSDQFDNFFKKYELYPFRNYVDDNTHYITVEKVDEYGQLYFNSKRNVPYSNIIKTGSYDGDLLYYLFIDNRDNVDNIVDKLVNENLYDKAFIVMSPCYEKFGKDNDLVYLKIYDKKVKELNGLKNYIKENNLRLVSLTSNKESNYLLEKSDIRSTFKNNVEAQNIDIWLENNTYDELFGQVKKLYYSKKYRKEV